MKMGVLSIKIFSMRTFASRFTRTVKPLMFSRATDKLLDTKSLEHDFGLFIAFV